MKHILIIASYGPSLINFRLHLIKQLLSKGYRVSVASPEYKFTHNLQKKLKDLGVNINIYKIKQGISFFNDCKTVIEIYKIIRNSKPNVIISYTLKPVIITGLILKFFKKIDYFPLITGLGYAFTETNLFKRKIFKRLVIFLCTESLKNSIKTIFQNKDDQLLFLKLKIIKKKSMSKVVNGSGIDLKLYPLSKLPTKKVFLMIARLLADKGVREYVKAAKIVRSQFPNVIIQLAGRFDDNPSSITVDELQSWIKQGDIKYLGEIKLVHSILKSCRYFVMPSYREGTPRSTLEALSTGRPIITTNVPGCRQTVIHKKNGLLIPAKNSKALANAMIRMLKEKNKIIKNMSKESFLIAKNKFEINKVNRNIVNIMKL